jgi:hypothetical protein
MHKVHKLFYDPTYHVVVVTKYKWDGDKRINLPVHTSNADFGTDAVDYISRHLFIVFVHFTFPTNLFRQYIHHHSHMPKTTPLTNSTRFIHS